MTEFVQSIGRLIIGFTIETGRVLMLLYNTFRQMVIPPYELENTVKDLLW